MASLLVASIEPAGKTALCAGIGRKLIEKGKKVCYLKPVSLGTSGPAACQDGEAMKDALELATTPESMCPLHVTREQLAQSLNGKWPEFEEQLKNAFAPAAAGAEVVILEGLSGADEVLAEANRRLAELFGAPVLLVVRYAPDISPSAVAQAAKAFGERWLGVVVNGVPQGRFVKAAPELKAAFSGVNLLGVLPEDRTLFGVSVAELARLLDAEVLTGAGKLEAVVENVMLGVLTQDSALDYFKRKTSKAVVARSSRPDMALAALETPTACLVLTGGSRPPDIVLLHAEKRRVPVLLVKTDTAATVGAIENALARARFFGARKYDRIEEVLAKNLDFDRLWKALGI